MWYYIDMVNIRCRKATFIRTVFVSGTFDLFDAFNAICEQHLRTAFNPFLNGEKNVTCEPGLRSNSSQQTNYTWARLFLLFFFLDSIILIPLRKKRQWVHSFYDVSVLRPFGRLLLWATSFLYDTNEGAFTRSEGYVTDIRPVIV